MFVLSKFRNELLTAHHLIICERTKFDNKQKSEISAWNYYNIGSDTELILRGRSFKYIMNNRGPRIDSWRTPCFNVLQSEKKFWALLGDFTSNFCLLLVK